MLTTLFEQTDRGGGANIQRFHRLRIMRDADLRPRRPAGPRPRPALHVRTPRRSAPAMRCGTGRWRRPAPSPPAARAARQQGRQVHVFMNRQREMRALAAAQHLGDQAAAVPVARNTRLTPAAAQVRSKVPTLPGSWMRSNSTQFRPRHPARRPAARPRRPRPARSPRWPAIASAARPAPGSARTAARRPGPRVRAGPDARHRTPPAPAGHDGPARPGTDARRPARRTRHGAPPARPA